MTRSSQDTLADVERVQIELLRRAGAARRAGLMCSLSRTVIIASRRELSRKMPDADEIEIGLRWVHLNYGQELADAVRRRLGR